MLHQTLSEDLQVSILCPIYLSPSYSTDVYLFVRGT